VVARVVDGRWRRLSVLIRLAFTTGLRRGNLLNLRWRDVDLDAHTVSVARTKNGRPMIVPFPETVARELARLSRQTPDTLVFEGRNGKPHGFRKLWLKTCSEAGLAGRNFHQLRHGTATALARAGVNPSGDIYLSLRDGAARAAVPEAPAADARSERQPAAILTRASDQEVR